MPIEILMPALSPTMTEGNLTKWVKKEGDDVRSGDVIAEIETDKATMEVEAADDGKLGRILVPEGSEGVKVKTVIALLVEEGEEPAGAADAAQSPAEKSEAGKSAPEDEAVEDQGTGEEGASSEQAASTMPETPKTQPAPKEAESSEASRPQASVEAAQEQGRLFVSPLARRMAQQAGIDLASISGSGPQGRIVKADIDAILGKEAKEAAGKPARPTGPATPASAAAPPQERPAAAPPSTAQHSGEAPSGSALSKAQIVALAGNPPYTEQKLSGMRRVIARRLSESKQTIPHFYMSVDCEIDRLLEIRAELNRKSDAYKISVNDFVIRAVALALKQVPAANASWSDEAILLWDSVDIAVAVALDEGLITPIVKQADRKGLAAIATETKELAARARAGKLKPEEFQGGTFSISNLGMHGIRDFAAVINPPHGGILAIGAGEQRAVVKAGALGIATVMSCTLSCDHRVVDGAVGAQFLAAFKKLVEDPLTMLL